MQRHAFLFTLFLLIGLSISVTAIAQTVDIPDPNLRAVVENVLSKASGDPILPSDMERLTELHATEDADITDLRGLEHATNLTFLNLQLNNISDISLLEELTNLTTLRLNNNAISDISVVAELTNLTTLELSGNNILDISALAGLTNLRNLDLSSNPISNISVLGGLTNLTWLRLVDNNISDISPLAGLTNLTWLGIWYNNITDISAVAGLTNLTWLSFGANNIIDISAVASLTNLTELWLDENSITDISAIAGLTNLTGLWLYDNNIADISPLVANTGLGSGDTVNVETNPLNRASIETHIPALLGRGVAVDFDNVVAELVEIPDANLLAEIAVTLNKSWGDPITVEDVAKLTRLDARNANISDLSGLEHATNLTELYLADEYVEAEGRWTNSNSVSDLSPLSGLINLTRLTLGYNNITDISPLAGLTRLTELQLRDNNITDISAVAGLTNLTRLTLGNNSVSNLSALSGLTNLTVLGLWHNAISDLSPLAGLTNLTELRIQGNRITDLSVLAGLTNLTRLAAAGNGITDISAVSGLTNLARLGLGHNDITDISVVSGLTNLTRLGLKDNNISDISVLAGLTSLDFVNLDRNSVSDLSPLVANTGIAGGDEVRVPGNPLSYPSLHAHIPALEGRGVDVQSNNRTPTTLRKISGTVTASDNVLIVEVRDENDNPFAGVPVTFTVTSGGGTLSVTSATTSTDGRAESTLTLGSDGEPNNVEASAADTEQTVAFSDVPEPTVAIPDPNLRAVVEENLGVAPGAPITVAEMASVTELYAYNAGISDLTGLEFATNLTELFLWNNNITDISPLEGLPNLTGLGLGRNSITDISVLSGLTNLTWLDLYDNGITDVSTLVEVLSNLTNLTSLRLGNNNITDISPLAGLTRLTELNLGRNSITDVSALAAVLSNLPNLTSLNLGNNNITDVSALLAMLSNLPNLTSLNLGGIGITDISLLSSLTNLTELFLWDNNITDISPLSGLTNLRQLYLSGNNITDISVVAGLTNLHSLELSVNTISDISALSGLTNLYWLNLGFNSISDISPLAENTGLGDRDRIQLQGNPLSYPSLRTHIPTLQGRGVDVQSDNRTPMTLEKVSGDQHGSPAAPLTNPFVVEVRDEWNRAFAGVPVTFAVIAGGGTLSVTNTETDPNGRAESTLTLGSDIGANTVSVSAAGIQQTVTFHALAREGIIIPDSKLRTAIGITLNKSFGETIVPSDMEALTSLEAEGAGISDLTGLELATDLTELRLSNNNISDISAVAGLTKLRTLDLRDNTISDISAVANLTDLTLLLLDRNNIPDISAVERLTRLTELHLDSNRISDISAVAGLTHLTLLDLGGNAVSDISAVTGLINLRSLFLWENSVSDISAVARLTRLTALNLAVNSVSDISVLAGLTNLTQLVFNNNSVSDISVVADLTKLVELRLGGNSVSDISVLAGLARLTELNLGGNLISDISALGGLTNLTHLDLWRNTISDISAVAGLTHLTVLRLWGNSVSDISVLAGLPRLTELDLGGNSISDISPLAENTGLGSGDRIWLWGNPLSYPSLRTYIPTLEGRDVHVEFEDRTPTTLRTISGYNQKGVSGETLVNPFVVEVQDRWNRAFAGIEVTFTVTAGGGTLSVTSTTTDPNGRAESTLTLGSDAGMNTVSVSAEGIQGTVTFNAVTEIIEFDLSVPADTSLIHVPLEVTEVDGMAQTIESIADLYDALGSVDTVNYLVTHDPHTQKWHSYLAPSDKGTPADSTLTDDMGIIAGMKQPVTIRLGGNPLGANGSSSITLHHGTNLVGVPLKNSEIVHVSDLLTLDGIKDNVSAITVSDSGAFKVVTAAGSPGDIPITGGQSFIMGARRAATVTISGQGWSNVSGTAAAPPLALESIEVKAATPVLVLRGSIVDEQAGLNKLGFRVTVKNLSTGRAVTAVKAPDEAGYRLTVVDIETMRAAAIGDVLEVSTRSANPQIGVEPLRYTVTAEDVKRSYVQLPELVVYEIPAETELLANYPNPFNPETWIPYRLAEDAFVRLTIYDGVGQVVRSLEVGHRIAAAYESRSKAIYWDGRNGLGEQVASGIYFYHLSAGDYSATRKMLIVK